MFGLTDLHISHLELSVPYEFVAVANAKYGPLVDGSWVISDDRCCHEMLRVHRRDGGSLLFGLVIKAVKRSLIYARLPLRLWVRRVENEIHHRNQGI